MKLQTIKNAIAHLSPAERLAIKLDIEATMQKSNFYEERNACIKTETPNPSFHQSKVTEFEEVVKALGGSVGKRGTPINKDGVITTCTCFKIPKGTGKLLHEIG